MSTVVSVSSSWGKGAASSQSALSRSLGAKKDRQSCNKHQCPDDGSKDLVGTETAGCPQAKPISQRGYQGNEHTNCDRQESELFQHMSPLARMAQAHHSQNTPKNLATRDLGFCDRSIQHFSTDLGGFLKNGHDGGAEGSRSARPQPPGATGPDQLQISEPPPRLPLPHPLDRQPFLQQLRLGLRFPLFPKVGGLGGHPD